METLDGSSLVCELYFLSLQLLIGDKEGIKGIQGFWKIKHKHTSESNYIWNSASVSCLNPPI